MQSILFPYLFLILIVRYMQKQTAVPPLDSPQEGPPSYDDATENGSSGKGPFFSNEGVRNSLFSP